MVLIDQILRNFLELIIFGHKNFILHRIYQFEVAAVVLLELFSFVVPFLFDVSSLLLSHSFLTFEGTLFKLFSFLALELVFL